MNNGGTIRRHPAVDHSLEDWDAVLRTNLDAVFLLSQRLGKGMIERGGGKIVNVASLLSFSGGITVPALHGEQARGGRRDEGARERVGAARHPGERDRPGLLQHRQHRAAARGRDAARARSARAFPPARWGEPGDLAGAVVFLASRASDYVNGHVLVVDGGWMAR